jgi:drug/metabolite transporter (DMT)-like permease
MRLRDRPLKLLLLTAVGTLLAVIGGVDLLDGEVLLRRYGELSTRSNPAMFTLYVLGYLLVCGLLAASWMALRSEWSLDYRPSMKPRLHDPERTRRS